MAKRFTADEQSQARRLRAEGKRLFGNEWGVVQPGVH